jgi:hypothetical protein
MQDRAFQMRVSGEFLNAGAERGQQLDSERLASAHRTEGVRSALPDTASSRPAMIGFNMKEIAPCEPASV